MFTLWWLRFSCGVRHEVKGLENLPEQTAIIMSKHQSTWETIGLRGLLRPDQSWVLKQELMRLPIFGLGLRYCKSIPIDRSAGRRAVVKVVEQGMARLAEGRYVVIFPEGTRSEDGQLLPFKKGGFHLALKSRAEVVPVAIIGSRQIVPKGSLRINRGAFAMDIGTSIASTDYSKEDMPELMARTREHMRKGMKEESAC